MKISFWITAVVLFCTVRFVLPNTLQVGTVLFTTTDIVKKCWTESDKALLRARLIMQDVLPEPDCINFSKPGVVAILLEYFQSCYEIISSSSYGKSQNLMFLALSDAVGGYLRAYILPISKRAFYAGQMNYSETSKLFQLYNDIKMFLKTNGVGWAKPYKLAPLATVPKPLAISAAGGQMACNELYVLEKTTKFHFNRPQKVRSNLFVKLPTRLDDKLQQPSVPELHPFYTGEGPSFNDLEQLKGILVMNGTKQAMCEGPSNNCKERSVDTKGGSPARGEAESRNNDELRQIFLNESSTVRGLRRRLRRTLHKLKKRSCGCGKNKNPSGCTEANNLMGCMVPIPEERYSKKIMIPLPVLDDSVTPFTLAVPFKCQPLRNIRGRGSAFILEHYYVSVIKCMINKGSSKEDIQQFNGHFFSWLCSEVYPHLADEVWYPAFGGVLRITETIKKLGADASIKDPLFNDVGYMFPDKFEFSDASQKTGKDIIRDVGDVEFDGEPTQSRRFLTYGIIISVVACVFVLGGCLFCMNSLKVCKRNRPSTTVTFASNKNPSFDEICKDAGRDQTLKKEFCHDNTPLTKAEKRLLKKRARRSKRDKGRHGRREKRKIKRVPDWKEVTVAQKAGGDKPAFPWGYVQKKRHGKGDTTDEDNWSKCMFHDNSMPTCPSRSPFIALQKMGSRFNTSTMEISTPLSTDFNQDSKATFNALDKIKLIWKKPSNKSTKTFDDKETQDTEQLGKSSLVSTFESSKKEKQLLGTIPSDSYTFSVEDERKRHHVKKRSISQDRSETCLMSSGTTTLSPSSETPETSSVDSETDDSCSSDESESSIQTTNYK